MNVPGYGVLGLLLCISWFVQAAETVAPPDRDGLPQRFAAYLEQHQLLAEKKTSLAAGQVAKAAAAVERRPDPLTTFESFIFGIHRHRARLLAAEQSERWDDLLARHTPVTHRWHDERNLVRCLFECSRWDYAIADDARAGEARREMEQWLDLRLAWMLQEEVAHHRFCRAAWQILDDDQRRKLLSGDWDAWIKKSTGHAYPLWADRIVTRAMGKPPDQAAFDETTAAQKAAYAAPHARYTAAAARHRRIGFAMDLNNEEMVVASWHEMAPSFRAIVLAEAEAVRALVHAGYASSAVDVAAKATRAKRALWTEALQRFPDGREIVKLTAAGEKESAFALAIDPQGEISGGAKLQPDKWQSLEFRWNDRQSAVALDGKPAGSLTCRAPASHGLSCLRLRSTAPEVDAAGLLVESVDVEVE